MFLGVGLRFNLLNVLEFFSFNLWHSICLIRPIRLSPLYYCPKYSLLSSAKSVSWDVMIEFYKSGRDYLASG